MGLPSALRGQWLNPRCSRTAQSSGIDFPAAKLAEDARLGRMRSQATFDGRTSSFDSQRSTCLPCSSLSGHVVLFLHRAYYSASRR